MKTRRSFRREGRILISGPTPRPERETGGTGVTPRRISRFRETGRGAGATAPSRRPNPVTPLSPPRSHLEGAFSLAVPPVSPVPPRNPSSQDQGAASRSWIGTVAVPCGAAQLLLRNRRDDRRVCAHAHPHRPGEPTVTEGYPARAIRHTHVGADWASERPRREHSRFGGRHTIPASPPPATLTSSGTDPASPLD